MEQFEEILLTDYCYESFVEYCEEVLFSLSKDKEYKKLVNKRNKLLKENQNVKKVKEGYEFPSLTSEESEKIYEYLLLLEDIKEIERKEIFIRGMKEAYILLRKMDVLK